jgi:hypothetical protein
MSVNSYGGKGQTQTRWIPLIHSLGNHKASAACSYCSQCQKRELVCGLNRIPYELWDWQCALQPKRSEAKYMNEDLVTAEYQEENRRYQANELLE